MDLKREIRQAAAGHSHSCTCDSCMEEHHHTHHGLDSVMIVRLITAGVLFVGGMICENAVPVLAMVLDILAILAAGYDVFISAALNAVRRRLFDESLLMSIVAIAACIIGEAEEGASVMILYQLGEFLQGYAVEKVRRNIENLMDNHSPEATEILSDVRSERTEKGQTEKFITRFARVYTPVLLGIAVLTAILCPLAFHTTVREGIYRALVLMVIACPCAIVISVPLSYFAGIGSAARQGVLFKSSSVLDKTALVTSVLFEKNGVLAGNEISVIAAESDRMTSDVLMRIAAHAAAYSSAPQFEAIKKAYDGVIYVELIQSFQEDDDGITVSVDGVPILLGTAEFLQAHEVQPAVDPELPRAAYVAVGGEYAGRILLGDSPKQDATQTVSVLSLDKHRSVAMITDDSELAAKTFAQSIGLDHFYAQPEDKIALVRDIQSRQIQSGNLLYLGDPEKSRACLEQADIGVSLNGGSSDAAILAADVVIMDDAPSNVLTAMEIARHTTGIVWQNIGFALLFKIMILVVDLFGVCPLWLAVFSDVGVALLAVLNALRAFLYRARKNS